MRWAVLAWLCLAWTAPVWAQTQPEQALMDRTTELQSINATRARESAAMEAEEAACYQRFSVSACLGEVQSRRRATLANLRRQEAALHEQEYAERGAGQLARSLQRSQEMQQRELQSGSSQPEVTNIDRTQGQKEKPAQEAARTSRPMATASSSAAIAPVPHAESGPTSAEQAANRESYSRKQADAAKRRQDIAKRLADKTAKTLPLTP